MKSLWKTILDGLTYKDLAGKRQPRIYTVVTGLILLLLFMAGGMAGLNRYLLMSRVQATPEAVTLPTQTVEPLAMETIVTSPSGAVDSFGCPTDSSEWSFTPTMISENYQIIQPACVYQGLEKTIAWALAIREGYSRAEATELLGFSEMPMRQMETGKPMDEVAAIQFVHSLLSQNRTVRGWLSSSSVPLGKMKADDISDDTRARIKAALYRRGNTNPTDADILNVYYHLGQK